METHWYKKKKKNNNILFEKLPGNLQWQNQESNLDMFSRAPNNKLDIL